MSKSEERVIIIGSGLGGLVCGYILAKNGYSVTILEKHYQIGGCLQTFTRHGVKFDTGMHYIGSLDEGQVLHKLFKYLDLLDNIEFAPLDPNGFDRFLIGDKEYRFGYGKERFIEVLAEQFPDNCADIAQYVRRVGEIADASFAHNIRQVDTTTMLNQEAFSTSFDDFIASCTDNPELRTLLAANSFLYAGVNGKTPAYIQAHINNFYLQSAYRIVGGSDRVAISLANSIKRMGGQIITNAEVAELVCNSQKMTHVRLKDGSTIEGQYFISNVHPQVTLEMIHSPMIRPVYRRRINEIENTISNFTLYMIFKKNRVKYQNYNFYYFDNKYIVGEKKYNPEDFPSSFLYIHQATKAQGEKFATSGEVTTYMNYDEVRRWADSTIGRRGADYEEFKQQHAEKIIAKLNTIFPGIIDNIEYYYTSSPLTYRDYTATVEGSLYGIEKDKNHPLTTRISQRTKIPNFFFSGQNIDAHGILGVAISAVSTSSELVFRDKLLSELGFFSNFSI